MQVIQRHRNLGMPTLAEGGSLQERLLISRGLKTFSDVRK
jgi:hypothetical protein